jgi:hypothetical protein
MMLRAVGLEETLRQLAVAVQSEPVDATTTLLHALSSGDRLYYTYEISTNPDALPMSRRNEVIELNCTFGAFRSLVDAGATIEHFYQRSDGSEIDVVTVTRDVCEN